MQAWTMVSEKNFNQEIDLLPLCSESNVSHRSESENSGARELVHRRGGTRIHVSTQVLDMGQISQEMQNMGISGLETGHKLLTNIWRISTKTYFSFKSP